MKKRLYQIDTLRFIAILFIILYHLMPHIYRGGFLGVNIFLVLAGYMNGRNFSKRSERRKLFKLFASCKRLLVKLYKPLTIFLLITSTYLLLFQRELLNNWFMQVITNLLFVNNWYQIIQGASYFDEILHPSILTHLWYLSAYVQFILLFWLIQKFTRPLAHSRKISLLVISFLTILSAILMAINFQPYSDPTRVYYGTDTRFFSFGIGLIASQISLKHLHLQDQWMRKMPLILLVLFSIFFLFLFELTDVGTFTYYGGMFLFDIIVALLVICLLVDDSYLSHALTFKPIAYLGQKSLGTYLVYYPVFIILNRAKFSVPSWLQSVTTQIIFIFLLGLLIEFVIAKVEFNLPSIYIHSEFSFKENFKSYLRNFSLKEKIWAVVLGLLTLTTGLSFLLSTSGEKANQFKVEYAEKMASHTNEDHPSLEGFTEEDIENYVSHLSNEKAYYVEPLSKESLKVTTQLDISFIGDSIMLGASEGLRTIYPNSDINAEVGRQLYNSNPIIENMRQNDELGQINVIALGSNGPFTDDQFNEFVQEFPEDVELFFVTTHVDRAWRQQVNDLLREKANQAENIHIIDWASHYQTIEEDILDADHLHLTPTGRRYWTTLITNEIVEFVS